MRLAIAQDSVLLREGLARLLGDAGFEVVAQCGTADELLELMATGSSNQGIADALVITLRAVEKYVSSIFGKLGLPSTGSESRRVLAVLMFLRS